MKVFLTGCTGAIGPATVRALLDKGHHVRGVARDGREGGATRARRAPSPSPSTCSTATR